MVMAMSNQPLDAAESLEALAADLRSAIRKTEARQFAGVKDGLAHDDFDGHLFNQGVLAGLRTALDAVERYRQGDVLERAGPDS
jgi:hypothetical protein